MQHFWQQNKLLQFSKDVVVMYDSIVNFGSMVEVFKTNVKDPDHANMLIDQIHHTFKEFEANFDLDDCDNILRVECSTGLISSHGVIRLLNKYGYQAEVLPDEIPLLVP